MQLSEVTLRPLLDVAAEENFRTEPVPGLGAHIVRRDPVEPVPVGSYVVMVFRLTGYDPDCDGSLMGRLEAVTRDGEPTGWEQTHIGLYPDCHLTVTDPEEPWRIAEAAGVV